jgi:hypothetical protein
MSSRQIVLAERFIYFPTRCQARAGLAQRMRLISFRVSQVTSGHGQLHLQVEELRLRHLVHHAPQGCCVSELRPPTARGIHFLIAGTT